MRTVARLHFSIYISSFVHLMGHTRSNRPRTTPTPPPSPCNLLTAQTSLIDYSLLASVRSIRLIVVVIIIIKNNNNVVVAAPFASPPPASWAPGLITTVFLNPSKAFVMKPVVAWLEFDHGRQPPSSSCP